MADIIGTANSYVTQGLSAGTALITVVSRMIRVATRGGLKHPPFSASSGYYIDTNQATKYYLGAAIIIGIILLSLIFTLVGCLCQYLYLICCYGRLKKKRKLKSNIGAKGFALFWILFVFVGFGVGALANYTGGSTLLSSIDGFNSSIYETVTSGSEIVTGINPEIATTFTNIKSVIYDSIDDVAHAVDFDTLEVPNGATANLFLLVDQMILTQEAINVVKQGVLNIKNLQTSMVQVGTTIALSVSIIENEINSWAVPSLTDPDSGLNFYLKVAVDTAGSGVKAADAADKITNAPNGDSAFESLNNVPNLLTYTVQITDAIDQMRDTKNMVADKSSDFKNDIGKSLDKVQVQVHDMLADIENMVVTQTDGVLLQVDQSFKPAKANEKLGSYFFLGVAGITGFIVATMFSGLIAKQPFMVKGINLCAVPFYLIIQVLALIFFILALVTGDVCVSVFENYPPPIAAALQGDQLQMVNTIFNAKYQCAQNTSLLTIVSDMGLVDKSMLNMTNQADKQLSAVDLSSLLEQVNDDALKSTPSPADQLDALTSLDLDALDVSQLQTVIDASIPTLMNSLDTLKTTLEELQINTREAGPFVFNVDGGGYVPSIGDYFADVRIQAALDELHEIQTTELGDLQSVLASAVTAIATMKVDIKALQDAAIGIIPLFTNSFANLTTFIHDAKQNLTVVLDELSPNILGGVQTEQDRLFKSIDCYELAQGIYHVQTTFCGTFLAGLDQLWFGYTILGVVAFISMPAIIYSTNRLHASKYAAQAGVRGQAQLKKDGGAPGQQQAVIGTDQYMSPVTPGR
ncbi:hypothetical protein BC833DRAFT_582996 [Globomyces pollinis-pini]|nr:hypothetical protein BC833DRAFT_582996 [Globomyces pollinis-pini]